MAKYDNNVAVVGAGSGGLVVALVAAALKARVTLIERGEMGGDCLNTGCVPSKTLISSARLAHQIRHADRYGLDVAAPQVDFAAVMARVRSAIATIAPKDSVARYTALGVNCIKGEARLLDPHHIQVDGRTLSSRSIVLATGGGPLLPPIEGLAAANPLTSDNVWSLSTLPQRLTVVGGGPIGCELAQAFARLGSAVTVIQTASRLLDKEDPDVSDYVEQVFRREGIDVRTGTSAVAVRDGRTLVLQPAGAAAAATGDGEPQTVDFDRILVAVGRRAHTSGYGLEAAGVRISDQGTIQVDKYLRTSQKNIYACGDVAGPYQFTHMAGYQAGYAALNALFGRFWHSAVSYDVVPWCTYIDPEVAHVGLSEGQATQRGIAYDTTRYGLDDLDRAIAESNAEGWIKVLTRSGSDRILGVTIVGPHAGELITEFVAAMTHGLGLKKIMSAIHVYPTFSEANKLAAGAWRRQQAPERALALLGRVQGWLR